MPINENGRGGDGPQAQYLRMRKRLDGDALAAPEWPAGVRLVTFDPATHPRPAHALLTEAYGQGGGFVGTYTEWWAALRGDPEYDPRLCLVVSGPETGGLVAFAQCWSSGFVKDIAVARNERRRGIGRALMLEVFRVFFNRGHANVDLKVRIDNPSEAVAFYAALGMFAVESET